ncbi:hypothetical protein H4219_001688 [Mycoemilia scoparia]|uniref:Uncharacterized protein n=1 Tax=Mycoemilia scoparia TaxID=417184 RepID=A0A9W8A7K8_9FUNG|nr:hypothetical protein H4219_001688 [Mycoemilia scoparia]
MTHMIIGGASRSNGRRVPDRANPSIVPRIVSVDDVTLITLSTETGEITDKRVYAQDRINLGGHSGVSMYKDRLCVVSLMYQCLRLYHISPFGKLVNIMELGWFAHDDDELVQASFRKQEAEFKKAALISAHRSLAFPLYPRSGTSGTHTQRPFKRRRLGQSRSRNVSSQFQDTSSHESADVHFGGVLDESEDNSTSNNGPLSENSIYSGIRQHDNKQAWPFDCLKQKILTTLYIQALSSPNQLTALQDFYRKFPQYEDMLLWKAQFIDLNRLLLKYAPIQNILLRGSASSVSHTPMLLVEYDIFQAKIINVYEGSSPMAYSMLIQRQDELRKAMETDSRSTPDHWMTATPSNDLYLHSTFFQTQASIRKSRMGGPSQAIRKAVSLLPIPPQISTESPLFDPSLFKVNYRHRSTIERNRPSNSQPVKFYDRHTGLFKFRLVPDINSLPTESDQT